VLKLIGIDTGGTYTDAVIFSETEGVLSKAKALTTRHDLSVGICEAVDIAIAAGSVSPGEIGMVAMSTTLATNAIVEGLGDRVGLVLIGFSEADLSRARLRDALRGDEVLFLAGGHDAHGVEIAPLGTAPLLEWIDAAASAVGAFAVAGQFSVANPSHELAVRDLLAERTGRPVTCSHELSAKLNAPKRALTSLLNARLVGTVHHLIDATESLMRARSIAAPMMVVKGDGSLISVAEARRKPIETILSGPAASIVGASYLTGLRNALVSDIGGTTTDVALLRDGRPRLDEEGAKVGGWSTMVEAVAMRTTGLGGDSEVRQDRDSPCLRLQLGPRRVIPVSLLAAQFPREVHAAFARLAAMELVPEQGGRIAIASGRRGAARPPEGSPEAEMLARIAGRPLLLHDLLSSRRDRFVLDRLVGRGAALISAFCPSDAAHVLGLHTAWDRDAAVKAATLFARGRTRLGESLAADAEEMSRAVVEAVTGASAEALLDAGFAEDGYLDPRPSAHPLVQAGLRHRPSLVNLDVRLSVPVVALGAAAPAYYKEVASRLRTEAVIPGHADVANAIGAVVGNVRVHVTAMISRPSDSCFRVHIEDEPKDFTELSDAVDFAERALRRQVARKAEANGAPHVGIAFQHDRKIVPIGGDELFLEMTISATGTGRPSFASAQDLAW
jgi:N-methylhydantoinase A/oxoprolinase/acetone carboxylase beta subunit